MEGEEREMWASWNFFRVLHVAASIRSVIRCAASQIRRGRAQNDDPSLGSKRR